MAGERSIKIKITGESSGIARAVKSAERSLKKLGEGAGENLKGLGNAVTSTLSSSGVYGAAAIIAAIAAAAPLVGAAITAGVLLGLGGGILALGIKSALQDPKVAAAFEPLKKKAQEIFKDFGEPFKGPLIESAKTFTDLLDKSVGPSLKRMGDLVAPLVGPLAKGLAGLAEKALPGIEAAVKASVPLFQTLAESAPKFGEAISKFLEAIAKGGPGAQQFLKDTFNFLAWILPKIGQLIGWLSNSYLVHRAAVLNVINIVRSAWSSFQGFFSNVANKVSAAASATSSAFVGFKNKVVGIWDSIVSAIGSAVNKIEGWWNRLKSLASSAINFSIGGFSIPGISGGRAAGGPVGAGRSYLVGEKGPEILTMGSSGGNITPNHALGGEQVINLALDLGEGIAEVFQVKIDRNNRQSVRRLRAS